MCSYRLLIVDDDVADRRVYSRLAGQRGSATCHARQALSGEAGLAELRSGTFHCVLLDDELRDMTASEFMTAASVDGELPCAFVVITAKGNETPAADTLGRVHGYLTKDQANTTDLWPAVTQAVLKAEQERLARSLRAGAAAAIALDQKIVAAEVVEVRLDDPVVNSSGGTVFLELPADVAASRPGLRPTDDEASSPCYRVLLVDDLVMNRSVIGAFLSHAGHVVTEANGGEEAVWLASEQPFDVILMDVRMPEVDGLEATRRIRTLGGACGQVPVLALTAHSSPDQKAKCQDAGMDGHLAKPVDYDTLMRTVDHVIAASASAMRRGSGSGANSASGAS
jgi:CheY-like chemotaxis protein